jgi:hypothetical protein
MLVTVHHVMENTNVVLTLEDCDFVIEKKVCSLYPGYNQ